MKAHRNRFWPCSMATVLLFSITLFVEMARADTPPTQRSQPVQAGQPGQPAPVPEAHSFELITDLVWGGGRYVAVGRHGLIMTSPDGLTWTTTRWKIWPNGWDEQLIGIAWGRGTYLAVSRSVVCLASPDGAQWLETRPEVFGSWSPVRIRWIGDRFYVIGKSRAKNSETTALFSSTDGAAWQRVDSPPDSLTDVAGDHGKLVAIGRTGRVHRQGQDGRWSSTALFHAESSFRGSTENAIVWNGSAFVATVELGYGSIVASSADGETWTKKEFRGFDRLFARLLWNGRYFVAVGSAVGSGFAISADGFTWTIVDVRFGNQGWAAKTIAGSDGATVVTTTRGGIVASNDGRTWRAAPGPVGLPPLGATRTCSLDDARVSMRTELKERVAESLMGAFSLALITFTMSGVGLLCYIVLQVRAIRRMTGYWRPFAWLPVPAMLAVLAATGVEARKGSNLSPLLLIFFVPAALVYLLLLLALRWVVARTGRQDQPQ